MTQSTSDETGSSAASAAHGPVEVPPKPATFSDRTPWSGAAAAVFVLAAIAIASAAGILSGSSYFQLVRSSDGPGATPSAQDMTFVSTMLTMASMQAVLVLAVWWAAGRFGARRARLLSLDRPLDRRMLLTGVLGMVAILGPYNLAVYALAPQQFANDLKMFSDLARSSTAWIALLVVTIGAPISEELTFRGFLLPAFAKARLGIIGAGIATSLAWTLLHVGYSLIGLVEVFAIGLYFAWLMWRFENLKLTIVLHALYNGLQMAILISLPFLFGN